MPVEGFKVDVEKAVGHQFDSEPVICNRRDFILYALGVGVKEDELKYLYELDQHFTPLPTYPLVLTLKGNDFNVNLFKDRAQGKGSLPGMPYYDPNKIVHGEQSLNIFHPFPVDGGQFMAKKTCTGVYDKGSGMVIEMTVDIYDEQEKVKYCSMVSKSFVRGYGGWNGPKGPKAVSYLPPKRNPDAIEVFTTTLNQALIYRLSGDYNPLHADTSLAPKIGFPKPILHGLCTYGACGHAIIKALANNDPSRFKSIEARFASPVFPGETIEIYMWKVDSQDHPKTEEGVIFIAKVKERDIVVINNGYAVLYKKSSESKL
ncbi:HotDog domain-containing protein [Cokeromyces recurvatus]|uniref:HotDog domain-containing protein n=1 Tax=Cokeromyces recurvatus TaxID=90255 RepID=UPI00221F71D8|nr:HotDog domain-containing protein [Cokeromyces recurvatus]KAI7897666.1 HotDog domain-containing protein [Cokeromyces recurvatus]